MISILNFNYLLSDSVSDIDNSLYLLDEKNSGDLFMLLENEYIDHYAVENKIQSLKSDIFWLKQFFEVESIRKKTIKSITKADVKKAFGEMLKKYKRGSSALNSCATALRKYYTFLNETQNKKLDVSIFDIRLPKRIHKTPHAFLFKDVISIFKANYNKTNKFTEKRDLIAFLLYSTTGARKNELTYLKVEDINFKDGTVKIFQEKTEEFRSVVLPPISLKYISLYLQEREKYADKSADKFFINMNGTNAHKSIVDRIPERFQKKYGVKFNLHQLRAGYISDLYDSGIDLTMVSRIIGHKSVDTTNKHYLDLQNKEVRRASQCHPAFLSKRRQRIEEEKKQKEQLDNIPKEVIKEYLKSNLSELLALIKNSSSGLGKTLDEENKNTTIKKNE